MKIDAHDVAALGVVGPPGGSQASRAVDGAAFVLDTPPTVAAVHGDESDVLWSAGEVLLLVAPPGVGKTTMCGQLVRGRLGLAPRLLGLPVARGSKRVLYIAADRPRQIARAFRRIFDEIDRELLSDGLTVWRGPLPFDLGREPDKLALFVAEHGADTLVIDSLTNVALDLAKDETGARVNYALQSVIATGVEVACAHHQRKASGTNPKPRTLSDVYGSTWLTAGAGSVVLLWGEAGDPVVDLHQLKPVIGEGARFRVSIDHERGTLDRQDDLDPAVVLARAGDRGLTAKDAARMIYEAEKPNRAQVERARRQLDKLVAKGWAERREQLGDVTYTYVTHDVTGVTR